MTAQAPEGVHTIDTGPPPIPGGVTELVRSLMGLPQAVQIASGLLAVVAVAVAARLLWRHRVTVRHRLGALPRRAKVGALVLALALAVTAAGLGYATYDYVEHDNAFCTSCHVMVDAYVRFAASAHAELGCHDCHQQPVSASLRQLYLWVAERPEEVGPHAPVPDVRCRACHIDQDPDRWPQVAASIGHRLHFESDDPDLTELMCVSCHGVAVHDFVPASETCGDCHQEADIQLGRMTGSTELHCVVCHDFLGHEPTRLPGLEERVPMAPTRSECLGCHQMRERVAAEQFSDEPHGGVCGACHNPHVQTEAPGAVDACEGCHTEVETLTDFHRSLHGDIHGRCITCHSAHTWKADMLECLDCHAGILRDDLSPPGRRPPPRDSARAP